MNTFGSFFSGIGGIDSGLECAGWICRWQVENNRYCVAVLRKHWPTVPKFGDVRSLTGLELERVDLIAGGFPCQPTSTAGKRHGQEDERWLWPEMARIIRVLRPRFVLVENPLGLLSANKGREMGQVLGDLATLRYDAEWSVLQAAWFGAPHRRERIFIIAYANEGRFRTPKPQISQRELDANRVSSNFAKRDGMERIFQGPISRKQEFSRFENIRKPQDFFQRHDIPEPLIRRGHNGIPARLDDARLATLGNSVVPQVAEWLGKRIIEAFSLEPEAHT